MNGKTSSYFFLLLLLLLLLLELKYYLAMNSAIMEFDTMSHI